MNQRYGLTFRNYVAVLMLTVLILFTIQNVSAVTELGYDDGSRDTSQSPSQGSYRAVKFELIDFDLIFVKLFKARIFLNNPAGGPGPQPVEVHILASDGFTPLITPIPITPETNWHWEEVTLPNIMVSGSFYIAISWQTDFGAPDIGVDNTDPSSRSYRGTPGSWTLVTNAFMIRVEVEKIESTVGGVASPINKLELMKPYIALVGVITAISTVYLLRRRKD